MTSEGLLTVGEVAKRLQLSERTMWKLIHGGKVPSIVIGRLRRIDPRDLEQYLQSCKTPSPERAPSTSQHELAQPPLSSTS